jgi:hypothetical protein
MASAWTAPGACPYSNSPTTGGASKGLLYGSSMASNADCLACFEPATDAMPSQPEVHRSLSDPLLRKFLRRAAITLGYGL